MAGFRGLTPFGISLFSLHGRRPIIALQTFVREALSKRWELCRMEGRNTKYNSHPPQIGTNRSNSLWSYPMSPFLGEFIGTLLLVLFGDGVVANVVLDKSRGQNSGWMLIASGRGVCGHDFEAVFG
jgi:hypothetical protein